jgi:hypothetical protein
VIAACTSAASASAASATTFYVNERGGTNSNDCTAPSGTPPVGACETIDGAIKRSEEHPGANTIEVSPEGGNGGVFTEAIVLGSANDRSLTIRGEEPGVIIRNTGAAAVTVDAVAGPLTLANLKVQDLTGSSAVIADHGAALTLEDVDVESQSGTNGIEALAGASVTASGGQVAMERGTQGSAILADEAPVSLSGTKVLSEEESQASGITSKLSTLSLAGAVVAEVEPEASAKDQPAIDAEKDTEVTLTNVRAEGETTLASTVKLTESPATIDGLNVEMKREQSIGAALEVRGAPASIEHFEDGGTWSGTGLLAVESNTTLADSHVIASPAHGVAAAEFFGGKETSLLIQRSIVQAATDAEPGALRVDDADATVDSSEILGGKSGVAMIDGSPNPLTFTLAASTLDAGAPGISGDAAGVSGIEAQPAGGLASANVVIEGSIVLSPNATKATAGGQATFVCTYSAVATGTQAGCEAGKSGNTNATTELASLFAEPFASYELSATSSAVDSVPVSAITLPFGLTPSTTDLAGKPRSEGVACAAVQDKGALELPGHGTPCPEPVVPAHPTPSVPVKALEPVLSALTISPSAFLAAPSGGAVSAATAAKKKKYGADVSYRDSQAATATLTVLRPASGRMQGKSCKKPSRKNKHGKHCTLYVAVGSFTHADRAGANSFRFSGRLKGKRLAPGGYRLQVAARDAAGTGAAVAKAFKIL